MNFTALLLLLLSDIPPRGSDHKREMYVSKDTQFNVSNQTNLSLKACVRGHNSGLASFFSHAKLSNLQSNSRKNKGMVYSK